MNRELRMRVLDQLLQHLESLDAGELRPKPRDGELEVTTVGVKPGEEPEGGDKGPMEKLLDEKESPEAEATEPKDDEDDVSDDELEELVREHLR
jgi:hypothetical protein